MKNGMSGKNMILKYAPQKECLNILDVGTGPAFCDYIGTKGHHVTAVDLTQDMLEQAKETQIIIKWKLNLNY